MSESLAVILAWGAGIFLGAIFFGGLWWTVRQGVSSKQPALWFVGSLMLRTCVTLAGFYVASAGHWERLLACLVGFVMASAVVARMTRPTGKEETAHAPHSR
jgi:F1F0 ATPase subunit 2